MRYGRSGARGRLGGDAGGVSAAAPEEDFAALAEISGPVVEMLEARNAELSAQVADLAERLAWLERAVSRNSGNSGMPPSADDLPGKKAPSPKPTCGGKKRQGKQKGAPVAYLAWSENPGRWLDVFPEGACACGQDLADADDLGVTAAHQVIDICRDMVNGLLSELEDYNCWTLAEAAGHEVSQVPAAKHGAARAIRSSRRSASGP